MSNRSYLYSTNFIPGPNEKTDGQKQVGIAKWDYDIPLVFKILLSGNPRTCLSTVWVNQDQIALIGDYALGVQNLESFLARITLPSAQALIAETLEFLKKPENQNPYFVLECGEIFEMEDSPLAEQNLALLHQIQHLQPEMDAALASLVPPPVPAPKPAGFLARLLGRAAPPAMPVHDAVQAVASLGLGNWSNILYFDFSDE